MSHWLKHNPQDDVDSTVRGSSRDHYLTLFFVHQSRDKKLQQHKRSEKKWSVEKSRTNKVQWMSCERMDLTIGPKKAEAMRNSKLLAEQPCSVTGSLDEHLKEYGVPERWETMTESDFLAFSRTITGNAGEDDDNRILNVFGNEETGDSKSSNETVVKTEACSELQKLKEENAELLCNAEATLVQFQANRLSLQKIVVACGRSNVPKYTDALKTDSLTLDKQIKKLEHILKKITLGEAVNETEVPKLCHNIRAAKATFEEVLGWANTFGIAPTSVTESASKKKKQRKS